MRDLTKRRGVALPFTILAMIIVSGFVVSMSNLNQGLKNQIFHTNNHQLSFLMAYSAFSRVLAKVHSFSWANRPFATSPYTENQVALQGGRYDLFVENTPGKDFQADIYIRTSLAGISRMYFWRIRFNDDLLDISNRILVEFFITGEPGDYPQNAGPTGFSQKVDSLLSRRAANLKNSDQMAMTLSGLKGPKAILEKLHGRTPEGFTDSYPMDPEDQAMASKNSAGFPQVEPISAGELPTSGGPGASSAPGANSGTGSSGTTTGTKGGFPTIKPVSSGMDDVNLSSLAAEIALNSQTVASSTDAGWKAVEQSGVGGIASLTKSYEEANKAKAETFDAMTEFLNGAEKNLSNAPSAEAKKAIEEMVSQTMVAGIQKIVTAIDRGFDQFDTAGDSYLNSLPTSADVENLLQDWKNAAESTAKDVGTLNSMAAQIAGYSKAPAVQVKLTEALTNGQKQLELINSMVKLAEARLAALKAQETAAAAAPAPTVTATTGSTGSTSSSKATLDSVPDPIVAPAPPPLSLDANGVD